MAMGTTTSGALQAAINDASKRYGIDPQMLHTFARIESGGNPLATTGSYRGVFQLGPEEFAKYGKGGDIFSVTDNTNAAAAKIADESAAFKQQYGRDPTGSELYMIHQQGAGGAAAHWGNPDQPAWQSMLSTGEGQKKGEAWAKKAIWGNVPDDMKAQYGSVDRITSRDFADMWSNKFERIGGGNGGSSPTITGASGGSESAPMPTFADRPTQTEAFPFIANAAVASSAPPDIGGGGGTQSDPLNFLMSSLGLTPQNQGDSSGTEMDALKQKVQQLQQQRDQAGYGQQQTQPGSIIAPPPGLRSPDLTKLKAMVARSRGRLGAGITEA